jgi:hypothetical protein
MKKTAKKMTKKGEQKLAVFFVVLGLLMTSTGLFYYGITNQILLQRR